jgi:hypothetical protein
VSEILIPVSPGELIDRLTILTIKAERIEDPNKLKGVKTALSSLLASFAETFGPEAQENIWPMYSALKAANEAVWDAEEDMRGLLSECAEDGDLRIQISFCTRRLHRANDDRFHIKREIDALMDSDLVEEKSYL